MKIGIGIDTGGTCTDAVIYQFEKKEILAFGKTPTTKDDLSKGIGNILDQLPRELVDQAEVIALSTTLATNACVENKGGRAKLIFFGVNPGNVTRVGNEYGLALDDSLLFIDSKTRPNGEIVEYPDWEEFRSNIHEWLRDCDAVGIVEMFAQKSGAELEKTAREIIQEEMGIPVVCGYSLFSESNIIKRGASALLNARLIFVIEEFLAAVKKALDDRNIKAPFVIVRSDGSLMTGEFTASRPVETLLCGPVASVMGATELTNEENCVIVDIGGTTTDIAFVKQGVPQRVKTGVRIGKWDTFVKGLFVDTFGLGGDSGVVLDDDNKLLLEEEKVMPLCMAAAKYPVLLKHLENEDRSGTRIINQQKNIYLRIKDISQNSSYTEQEIAVADYMKEPHSLEEYKKTQGETILVSHIERLIREGVLIRCGLSPTDVMHVKGDFDKYDKRASVLGVKIMARAMWIEPDELAEMVYDEFKKKLYYNIVRILIEDAYPRIRECRLGEPEEIMIKDAYQRAKYREDREFIGFHYTTPATLVGVGAPTKLFLEDVAKLLEAKVVTSEYSSVANALGAVVGNVSASVQMEVTFQQDISQYVVFGCGQRIEFEGLEEAKSTADEIAREKAREEAVLRGAEEAALQVSLEVKEDIVQTEFGPLYMGYKVVATASGNLRLT